MSAGEFFDLVRPVFLILSALLSVFVLASARRSGFRAWPAIIWALATFFLPLVTLPIYLLFRISCAKELQPSESRVQSSFAIRKIGEGFFLPFFYAVTVFALIAFSQYREYNAFDAYLARAKQAKLDGDRQRTIREYKAALALAEDAHTHKLLGIELYDAGEWAAALSEFRLAERGGEDDDTLPFRIGLLLDVFNQPNQAEVEYRRFLNSEACSGPLREHRCEIARQKIVDRTRCYL